MERPPSPNPTNVHTYLRNPELLPISGMMSIQLLCMNEKGKEIETAERKKHPPQIKSLSTTVCPSVAKANKRRI